MSPTDKDTSPAAEVILTVSQFMGLAKEALEDSIGWVYVEGEVSKPNYHASGHCYFSIKDDAATLSCTMWKFVVAKQDVELKDGMSVVCFGQPSIYAVRGSFSLNVRKVVESGAGALKKRMEELHARLEAEGLFATGRKQPIPYLPLRIGVISAPESAAIIDFDEILRNSPLNYERILFPALMQGEGAPASIITGLEALSEVSLAAAVAAVPREGGEVSSGSKGTAEPVPEIGQPDLFSLTEDVDRVAETSPAYTTAPAGSLDLIVITRGGGSWEDLLCFNDESLVRAIAACPLPVISAVGHERDWTFCDEAADLRCATPTDAARVLGNKHSEALQRLAEAETGLRDSFTGRLEAFSRDLVHHGNFFSRAGFGSLLDRHNGRLELQRELLRNSMAKYLGETGERVNMARQRLGSGMSGRLPAAGYRLDGLKRGLLAYRTRLEREGERLAGIERNIRNLSLSETLRRGFALLTDLENNRISRPEDVAIGDDIEVRLAEGSLACKVTEKRP